MKKNLFKSLTGTLLALTLTLGIGTVAFAGQAQGTSTGHTFGDNDWKAYAYSGTGSVTYGYNTAWINEDFAWGYCSDASHTAALRNANGWHYGPTKSKGDVSKIEVTHSYNGTAIKYQCNW